jgi:hypothetical protein
LNFGDEESSSAAPPSKETDFISDFNDENSCVVGIGVGIEELNLLLFCLHLE